MCTAHPAWMTSSCHGLSRSSLTGSTAPIPCFRRQYHRVAISRAGDDAEERGTNATSGLPRLGVDALRQALRTPGDFFVARRPKGSTVGMLGADRDRLLGEQGRDPESEGVRRVCSGLSAAGGGVANATQLPLGVKCGTHRAPVSASRSVAVVARRWACALRRRSQSA